MDSRLHRHEIERTLASALGPYLVNNYPAEKTGAYIREVVDAMMGQDRQRETVAFSYSDRDSEAEIVAAGLTAPRVTSEQIQALMEKLTWSYEQPEGTTSTFAHAYLGRFYVATGHSACVSPENFNAELGMKYAREQAEVKARDKLWELEGYKLFAAQAGAQAQCVQG